MLARSDVLTVNVAVAPVVRVVASANKIPPIPVTLLYQPNVF